MSFSVFYSQLSLRYQKENRKKWEKWPKIGIFWYLSGKMGKNGNGAGGSLMLGKNRVKWGRRCM